MMHHLQVGAESPWLVQAGAATLLYTHIGGGLIAIIAGGAALAFRKGGRRHALAGNVFFVAMIAMTSVGACVAPFLASRQGEPKLGDSIAGFFTLYLVVTSWLTVKRKAGTIGRAEVAAFLFAILLAAAAALIGIKAARSPTGLVGGFAASGYYVVGSIIALAAALDARVILNRGIAGPPRIARHLWRMCLALFVASGSFFLGQQRVMPEAVRGSPILLILGLAPLAFMLFWLVRVRFGKRLRAMIEALGGSRRSALAGRMEA